MEGVAGEFYHLPSEAEGGLVRPAGTTTAYSFADDPQLLTEYVWVYTNSEDRYATSKVGQLKPNP